MKHLFTAVTSTLAFLASTSASGALIFSEIMYDPASLPEHPWEWIEVYNSGPTDFDLSGYVIDDINSDSHGSANIVSGTVAAGSLAILFNASDNNATDFANAWGGGPFNLIGVNSWFDLRLNNTGDQIGIWEDFASYSGDHQNHINVIHGLTYDDSSPWPSTTGTNGNSIYLTDLSLDDTVGANWARSEDGMAGAFTSAAVGTNTVASSIGSPGVAPGVSVPEPTTFLLLGLGLAGLGFTRRRLH